MWHERTSTLSAVTVATRLRLSDFCAYMQFSYFADYQSRLIGDKSSAGCN